MGYCRVVQAGNSIEIYQYEKDYVKPPPRKSLTLLEKQRRIAIRLLGTTRSEYSCRRARRDFYRLVRHNINREGDLCFLTLTTLGGVSLEQGYRYIYDFKKRLKNTLGVTISYIAVPEWQKKGRLHYHLLVWGIPEHVIVAERSGRFLQRQYARGYIDVLLAYDRSPKLASYLAKYMQKAYRDERLSGRRAYNASRDIEQPRTAGSNALSAWVHELVPVDSEIDRLIDYDTVWFGRCNYKRVLIASYDGLEDP